MSNSTFMFVPFVAKKYVNTTYRVRLSFETNSNSAGSKSVKAGSKCPFSNLFLMAVKYYRAYFLVIDSVLREL